MQVADVLKHLFEKGTFSLAILVKLAKSLANYIVLEQSK